MSGKSYSKHLSAKAAKVLYYLIDKEMVIDLLDKNYQFEKNLKRMVKSGDEDIERAGFRILREINQNRHNTEKSRYYRPRGRKYERYENDKDLCECLCQFLDKCPSANSVKDALLTLYYCLDLMDPNHLNSIFNDLCIYDVLDRLKGRLNVDEFKTTIKKIQTLPEFGNAISENQTVMEIRSRRLLDNKHNSESSSDPEYGASPRRMPRNHDRFRSPRPNYPPRRPRHQPVLMSADTLPKEESRTTEDEMEVKKKLENSDPEVDQRNKKAQQDSVIKGDILAKLKADHQLLGFKYMNHVDLEVLTYHIVALLNSGKKSFILIGAEESTRKVLGVKMNRKEKDLFRQGKSLGSFL